jgi:hypothetical protein
VDKEIKHYMDFRNLVFEARWRCHMHEYLHFELKNLEYDKDSQKINHPDKVKDIVLPPGQKGLVVKPTLFWSVEASRATSAEMEVAYLTDGINWHAEYVAAIAEDEKSLGLSAWVSIDNQSGATYPDAKLKLIAGDVHRVQPQIMMAKYDMLRAEAAPRLEEKAFFEYHMYTLGGTSTIKEKEVKQIQLFPETTVPAAKLYNFDAYKGNGVRVVVKFDNSKKGGLGIPLPAGKVRVFKADADGSLEFLGEDEIDHTPRDEEVKLYVGDAFDVVATREQKNLNKISDRVLEETFEVSIANHKDADITVTVDEHFYGEWKLRNPSHPYKKIKSDTAEFEMPVGANSTAVLSYTVRREI